MAKKYPLIVSFSNDGFSGPITPAEVSDRMAEIIWSGTGGLWRVCWAGVANHDGFFTSYDPQFHKKLKDAERRMDWGMKKYPHLIYWLENVV